MALSSRYTEAVRFVAEHHAAQKRIGTEIPYLSHLLAVSSLVLDHGGDEDEAIAALLHDLIEDQARNFPGGTDALRKEIADRFGTKTLQIVNSCTDADTYPKPPWKARKVDYLRHIVQANRLVLLVSCADKLHNARAILMDHGVVGGAIWDRFKASKEETLWYYRELVQA